MKIILRAGTPPLYFWKTFPGISPAARAGRSVFFNALGPGSVGLVHDRIDGQIVAPVLHPAADGGRRHAVAGAAFRSELLGPLVE